MSIIKYAAIVNTKKKERIVEEFMQDTSIEFETEIQRIIPFYLKYKLNTDERKKIISKVSGNWLAIQAANKILYIVLLDNNITEMWGYEFLSQIRHQIDIHYGPEFYKTKATDIQKTFQKNFAKTTIKFNEFFTSNVLNKNVEHNPETPTPHDGQAESNVLPKVEVSDKAPSMF